jgi:hypothetical protein
MELFGFAFVGDLLVGGKLAPAVATHADAEDVIGFLASVIDAVLRAAARWAPDARWLRLFHWLPLRARYSA